MWYAGLGAAFERGKPGDVYWLIPGDFNYGAAAGREVLGRLQDLPEIILELDQDLCIGEIATDHNNSKQLIDTTEPSPCSTTGFPPRPRPSANTPSGPGRSSLPSAMISWARC